MMLRLGLIAAVGLATQVPTFDFAGLNTTSELTFQAPELERCVGSESNGSCALLMRSFADVPILHSIVTIKDRHLYSLIIHGPNTDYGQAIDALKAKYGKPSNVDLIPSRDGSQTVTRAYWWTFSDGVLICSSEDGRPQFSLTFASNKKVAPKIDF